MIKDLKHLCFDKDGILIDVHAYWKHTTVIRAQYLRNHFKLNEIQETELINAMESQLFNLVDVNKNFYGNYKVRFQ